MTTTVTISANYFTVDGRIPAGDIQFTFMPVFVDINSTTDTVTSRDSFSVATDANGAATFELPDAIAGNGIRITSAMEGWRGVTVASYPSGTITLPDLINQYSVDPSTLAPSSAPPAWWTALAGVVKSVNGVTPDDDGNVVVQGGGGGATGFSIGTVQPTAVGEYLWVKTDGNGNLLDMLTGKN